MDFILNVASEKDKLVDWGYNKIDKSKKKNKGRRRNEGKEDGTEGQSDKEKRGNGGKEKEQIYFITFKICLVSTYSVRST